MNRQPLSGQMMGLAAVLLLLAGCAGSTQPESTTGPPRPSTPILEPSEPLTPSSVRMTATPDPCTGWRCTLSGIVYLDAALSGNELARAPVELSQFSYCSPTRGEHTTTTGTDGSFEFAVFLHDTDTFLFQVEQAGYEPIRQSLGGFDCLYCACPPVEIVLKPVGSVTFVP